MPKLDYSVANIESNLNKIEGGGTLLESSSPSKYVSAKAFNEACTTITTTINNDVNSLVSTAINSAISSVLNSVFPVGAIMTTFDSSDYSQYLGFTWERLENTFLYADGSKSLGTTGGVETHTLTVDEMPKHSHGTGRLVNTIGAGDYIAVAAGGDFGLHIGYQSGGGASYVYSVENGGGEAHDNMPPFTVVRMWKRTA